MPADTFQCPQCQAKLKYSSNLQPGTTVRCPQCQNTFPIPEPEPPAGETTQPLPSAPVSGDEVTTEPAPVRGPHGSPTEPRDRDRGRPYPDDDEDYPRPPRGEYGDGDAPPLSNRYDTDLSKWFNIASAHYGAILGPAIGFMALFTIAYFVLVGGASLVGGLVMAATGVPGTDSLLGAIVGAFVITPLIAGLYYVCLRQLDGRPWSFGDFFVGFSGRFYVNLLVFGLLGQLLFLPAIVPSLLGNVVLRNGGAPELAMGLSCSSLLLLIALLYFYIRLFYLTLPLMLDRGLKPIDAIKASWTLTDGHFWIWFAISLLLGLMMLLGACVFCIGAWFVMPFAVLVQVAGYMDVAGVNPPLPRPDARSQWRENG